MENIQKREFILVSSHGGKPILVDAHFPASAKPMPVVVFVHGFKGFKDWGTFNLVAGYFARQGFAFVKLNLSHNGTTPKHPVDFVDLEAFGHNNFSIELDDIGQLIDHLANQPEGLPLLDMERLYLLGHSRGGATALLKAAEDQRVRKLATWSAIDSIEDRYTQAQLEHWEKEGVIYIENSRTGQQMPLYFQLVEDFRRNKARLDVPALAKTLVQEVLVVHGKKDPTVPAVAAHHLHEWCPKSRLLLVPEGDHTFGSAHPWPHDVLPPLMQQVAEETCQFFEEVR